MTLGEINTKISSLTGSDTTSYPSADRVIDLNITQETIVGIILDSQDESDYDDPNHGDFPILNTSLGINQRDYGIPVAEYLLEIKDVNVTYDGTNWVRAHPIDRSTLNQDVGNDTLLDNQFNKNEPRYDVEGFSVFLYPRLTEGTGQITIRGSRAPYKYTTSDLSTGTLVPGFDSTFHIMLAYGAAYEYASSKQLEIKDRLQEKFSEYEARLRRQYGRKQRDRNLRLQAEDINYN